MSDLVLTIRRDADRDALLRDLDAAGVRWEGLTSIRYTILVEGHTVEDFPLRGHPALAAVDDGHLTTKPFAAQTVLFDGDNLNARWGLIRHTRRDAPWPRDAARFPFEADFDCARTGAGVDVYMIDSGMRLTHSEWGGRPVGVVYKAAAAAPDDTGIGHGTLCMSAAVGVTCGFARSANIWSAQSATADGISSVANQTKAIDAVLTHWKGRASLDTPGVGNMSFGITGNYLASICTEAAAAGFVLCAAAGNDLLNLRTNFVTPVLNENVLSVGGIAMDDRPYNTGGYGSNYGDQLDILVASQEIYCAQFSSDTSYNFFNGTSPGCGHVSGIVACMLEGYRRPTTIGQIHQLHRYIRDQATYGRFRRNKLQASMRDGIIFLDPRPIDLVPPIPGLVRKT